MHSKTISGAGIGLRSCHYTYIEREQPQIPWFEVLSDNYLNIGGSALYHLEQICEHYPVTLHGVGMSLGSTDPLNLVYLKHLKNLIEKTHPPLVSDHLCWTSFNNEYFHELFPLPYTEEALKHVVQRIQQVQDFLEWPIAIENVSQYLQFSQQDFTEWDFLQTIADEANCFILLDVNNVYVSAINNDFDPLLYLRHLKPQKIAQYHLAGYTAKHNYLLDTHGSKIQEPVWQLFTEALKLLGPKPACIEWDTDIPDFTVLEKEAKQVQYSMENYVIPA